LALTAVPVAVAEELLELVCVLAAVEVVEPPPALV
jgi:hypothetical protein